MEFRRYCNWCGWRWRIRKAEVEGAKATCLSPSDGQGRELALTFRALGGNCRPGNSGATLPSSTSQRLGLVGDELRVAEFWGHHTRDCWPLHVIDWRLSFTRHLK